MVIVFDDGDWIESKDQSSEGVRLLQTGNIGEGYFVNKAERKKFISEETFEKLKCKEVYSGDILISRLPEPVGRACIVPELDSRLITAVDCTICRINEDIVNKEYLCYFFQSQSYYNQVKQKVAGTTRKRISRKNLEQIKVYLPLLDIQGKIVQKLNTVSELISYRKKQLEDFDLLVKSQFVEMFGDCVINSKGWKTKRLEDIAKVGSSKRVFVEELQDSGIPFYRGTEVGALAEGKQIVPELFITEKHYVELCETTGVPQIGDLLMPSICPDGRIWVVNTDEPFYFKDGRVLWVHVIDNSYNSIFLLYTLKDRIMTDYNSIASGTTFAELKIFALKKCQIFDVPLALQNEFATFVQQIDKSKLAVQKSLEELETLKQALMQQYFGRKEDDKNLEHTGIKSVVLQEIKEFAKKNGVKKVILFGSRARGNFERASDIDLAAEGGDVLQFKMDLKEEASTLLDFDVVDLSQKIQEKLLHSIQKEGIVIYEEI